MIGKDMNLIRWGILRLLQLFNYNKDMLDFEEAY